MPERLRRTLGAARRVWRALGEPADAARAELDAYLLNGVLRRPILSQDTRELRYLLEPGENARAYFERGGNYETRFCERWLAPGTPPSTPAATSALHDHLLAPREPFRAPARAHLRGLAGEPPSLPREPRPEAAENVLLAQTLYRHTGTVELHLFPRLLGAWDSLGSPTLVDPCRAAGSVTPTESIRAPAVRLDDDLREHAVERVDLLKVEVEGAEPAVLARRRWPVDRSGPSCSRSRSRRWRGSTTRRSPRRALPGRRSLEAYRLDGHGSVGEPIGEPHALYGKYVALRDEDAARAR